jgi:phosphoglycolate phosphatase-like HAD superfamily hydrolase
LPDGEIQALLFDFNGTLSDDASELLPIYRQIASEMGLPSPKSPGLGHGQVAASGP